MLKAIQSTLQDKNIVFGLGLLLLSFLIFSVTIDVFQIKFDIFTGAFFANYGLFVLYFISVLRVNKSETGKFFRFRSYPRNIILLQLFNISAYALNRTIPVFSISTDWLIWFLFISNIILLLHALSREYKWTKFSTVVLVFSNLGILFHLYESIYMLPLYPFTLLGSLFFGISLHALVPALFLWVHSGIVARYLSQSQIFWKPTILTWAFSLGLIGWVTFQFYESKTLTDREYFDTNKPFYDDSLPYWVVMSQQLKRNWVTERYLKCGLTYTSAERVRDRAMFDIPLNERIQHDPLVVIASLFTGPPSIGGSDRIHLLRTLFDERHTTERKLWSGENLSTSSIVTNVQLFPEYRLAYTERILKIKNTRVQSWRNQQEALYTFYLPEGSVVSSASLWVNGKEEPAYLTTKSKADSAYQAIVGRERRDPLLLHWQEGSKVTVRVFPCTPAEERQFKIGITTPLKNENGVLEYENIDFKGPYWNHANEEITIVAEDGLQNMDTPFYFGQSGTAYTYSGKYHSKWSLTFDEVPLAKAPFYFNGKAYRVEPYETQTTSFAPRDIYLDINKAWTKKELMVIWGKVKKQKVWVYANNRMQAVTESNIKPLFHHLKNNNFTLFPFHKIGHPQSALVISKYHQMTPTISDIGKSKFAKRISDFLGELDEPIKVFNLGEEQSQYLKTLKEIRSIQLESGLVQDLADLLDQKSFIRNQEDEATVVNQYSGLKIQKVSSPGNQVSKAPDHLMRLFVYNDILKQLGKDYFNKKKNSESLIPMASEAYVVTPISSLIVLETQEDYDRFNIKKSKNSLNNAAILDSGAVPEPHEWLLIILVMLLTLYFYTKQLS